ncbi:MAG: DotU family type IV/VI secretion system protein [Proteobacteria bacterium]|nr:DotU family type IV/VI secretion system protein [Pseudomonadota bacterium]
MIYTFNTSIFVQNFQEFYYEVLRQKEKALRTFENEVGPNEDANHIESVIQEIQKKLHQVLEVHSLQASKNTSGITASYFRDAQYVMVSLADEVFLNMEWSGTKVWRKILLEGQVFQTQVAGEQFFKRLDALLQSSDPARSELAQVYLTALSLGFKGRYNEGTDQEQLNWYRDQLYLLIKGRHNDLYYPGKQRLNEDPYSCTISEHPGKGLPDLKTWVSTLLSVLVVYVFISYIVWHKLASEMNVALNEIYRQLQKSTVT